ncbi:K21394 yiaM; TRAP-type transport system small permease protein [Candidatus Pelagibacterales bacterium]|jgi:TRAP-type C4-dicarboxylate transport system permease small subunit
MQYLKKFIINAQLQEKNTNLFFSKVFGPVIAIIFFVMIIVGALQIFLRYFFNISLSWSNEILIFSFIWITYLSITIALSKKLHLGVDMITNLFPNSVQLKVKLFSNILIILFCIIIFFSSIPLIKANFFQFSPSLGIRMSYIYASIPTSMLSMAFITFNEIVKNKKE